MSKSGNENNPKALTNKIEIVISDTKAKSNIDRAMNKITLAMEAQTEILLRKLARGVPLEQDEVKQLAIFSECLSEQKKSALNLPSNLPSGTTVNQLVATEDLIKRLAGSRHEEE